MTLAELKAQLVETASATNAAVIGMWTYEDVAHVGNEFRNAKGRWPSGDEAVAYLKALRKSRGFA